MPSAAEIPVIEEMTPDQIEATILGSKPSGFFDDVRALLRQFSEALADERQRANRLNQMPLSEARSKLMAVHDRQRREIIAMGRALHLMPDSPGEPPRLS